MDEEKFTSRDEAIDFGKDYEYLMAAYYALVFTFNDEVVDFKLSTNNKDMGDFDDVVIEIELKNGEEHLFALQLKHVARTIALITLTTDNKKFSLEKYSHEFKKIKTGYEKSRSYSAPFENFHFVLYSNSVLEKFEEIDEDGKRLETIVDKKTMKKGDSHITIQRCNNCIGRNLLNLCDVDDNFIYKFKTDKEGSVHEEFFKQFSFYTRQKNAKEVQSLIGEIIFNKFQNCDSDVVMSYLNYFTYWCRRDYGAFKLTKQDIKFKLAELVLTPHIPSPNLENLKYVASEKHNLIQTLFFSFDIIQLKNESDLVMNKIWEITLNQLSTLTTEWSKPVPGFYISTFQTFWEIPISAQSETFNEVSLKKVYIILWHSGIMPLIVKFRNDLSDQNIFFALELCKSKEKKRFIVLGENNFSGKSDWLVFRDLSDLSQFTDVYQNVTEHLSVSLQGRSKIPLQQFVANDERLQKIITFKEIILMLDDEFIIGNNCLTRLSSCYITRMIPKILLKFNAINEIEDDLFIISYQSRIEEIHTRINCSLVDINKYILLKQHEITRKYIPKQFFISGSEKLKNQNVSDKLVILVDGNCTKEQFQQVCSITQHKDCHHVRIIDNEKIEWVETQGSIDKLKQYQQDSADFKSEDFVEDVQVLDYFNNKINILCADAGMGKTIMMTALTFMCSSTHWVIKVNFNDHTKFFKERHNVDEILEYLLKFEDKDRLVEEIEKIFFDTKKLLILWDGFDELPENCITPVVLAIKDLSSDGYLQWISARSSSKKFLEDTFNVFSLTLTQFDSKNQYDFVYNHLKKKYESDDEVAQIINKIDEAILTSLSTAYLDYSRNPLHIHMVVQIFLNNPQRQIDQLQMITITDMYQEFIQGKFDCMFKKAEADSENYYMQQIQEQYKSAQLSLYKIAALKGSFDEEIFATLNLNCDELLEELSESEDTLGLIIRINDDQKPVFAHKTYEEFLTALWLIENYEKHPDLITMIFQEKYSNIRLMFDMLMARNSPVHFAVLYRKIDMLEKYKNEVATVRDSGGRTALHLACAWGTRFPVVETMNNHSENTVVNRSSEMNRQYYLNTIDYLVTQQKSLLPLLEILTDQQAIDTGMQLFNNIYSQVDDSSSSNPVDESNKILIFGETMYKPANEDDIYLKIVNFLLEHNCNPLENDELLHWNSFQYADETLSLAAIDVMIKYHQINFQTLKNFNHIPTLVHYGVGYSYNNILETIDDIPYIEYKFNFGRITLLQVAVETCNFEGMSKLLKAKFYQDVVNVQSPFSSNPLTAACILGNANVVNLLLENGAKVNETDKPALVAAVFADQKECCEKLLEAGADVNAINDIGISPLIAAAIVNRLEIMKLLLDHEADVHVTYSDFTVLNFAIRNRDLNMVRLLLKHKPDINHQTADLGFSVLHYAVIEGALEIIKCLVEHGADIKAKTKDLLTPLYIAIKPDNEEMILELIKMDPSAVNEYSETKETPLTNAAYCNSPKIIEMLIENGADVHSSESDTSPLHIASSEGFDSCVTTLIKAGASVNRAVRNEAPLFLAVPNFSTFKILLDNGADVNFKNNLSRTALHRAAFLGKIDVAEELLKKGANIDVKDQNQMTPLQYSINCKHMDMAKFLLDRGASVKDGGELLYQAVLSDLPECILLLLEHGVEVNALDKKNNPALYYAVVLGRSCAKTLLDKGANPNATVNFEMFPTVSLLLVTIFMNKTEATKQLIDAGANVTKILNTLSALHVTAARGDITGVLLFLAAGVDANIIDENTGRTPLHSAAEYNQSVAVAGLLNMIKDENLKICLNNNADDCVKELIAQGANINQKDYNSLTPLHVACHEKNSNLIKLFINHGADVNLVDDNKQTPLHICFIKSLIEDAELLVKNGAHVDITDKFGKTPFAYAVENLKLENLNFLKKLKELGADINLPNESGFTLLHKAAFEGKSEIVAYLLDAGANVEAKTAQGSTPLFYACSGNYKEIFTILLEKSCEINVQNHGNIPLHLAAVESHQDIIKSLCEAGSEINVQNLHGVTALHCTSLNGCYYSCKFLIEAGAEINRANTAGKTPFHLAIISKNLNLIKLFVENGVIIDQTSFHHAALTNDLDVVKFLHENAGQNKFDLNDLLHTVLNQGSSNVHLVEYLLQNGADPNSVITNLTALQRACLINSYDYVKLLIENGASVNKSGGQDHTPLMEANMNIDHGANINQKQDDGWTPLSYASSSGNLDLVKLLHEKGADLFVQDKNGGTLLIHTENASVVKYLVDNGVSVNHANDDGVTPLYHACCKNDVEGARYLLEHGADVNFAEKLSNRTPMQAAALYGHLAIVELLLSFDADVALLNNSGQSVIIVAVLHYQLDIVKLLAEKFANPSGTVNKDYVNHLEKQWQTCLFYAAAKNFTEMLKFLHEKRLGEINNKDETGLDWTALHYACYYGSYESGAYLIENGANIEVMTLDGLVPLYLASQRGYLHLVKLLIEHDAQIDEVNNNGNTSLFVAAAAGHLEIVIFLHENGGKVHVVDNDGDTPLHDAAAYGHLTVVQYLVSKNADLDHRNKNGKTPLDLAADNSNEEVVEFLKSVHTCE